LVCGWNDGTVPISFIFDRAELVGVGNGLMKTPATTSLQPPVPNKSRSSTGGSMVGGNLTALAPDANQAVDYKKGYIMRKSCVEPEGRKSEYIIYYLFFMLTFCTCLDFELNRYIGQTC